MQATALDVTDSMIRQLRLLSSQGYSPVGQIFSQKYYNATWWEVQYGLGGQGRGNETCDTYMKGHANKFFGGQCDSIF